MSDPRLGRRVSFDERSRNFPIRAIMPTGARPRSYTWSCPVWLDQGRESSCVGFAISHEAAARPVSVKNITADVATRLYKRARELDEWPGTDYLGTSVLGGAKAGQEKGWYGEYRWSFSLEDLILAIGYKGPAVLGLNWYDSMMEPDKNGLVKVTGEIAGGHAILARGVNIRQKLVRLRNSWGRDWGIDGDCFISFDDLKKLLYEYGEACVPVKRAMGI